MGNTASDKFVKKAQAAAESYNVQINVQQNMDNLKSAAQNYAESQAPVVKETVNGLMKKTGADKAMATANRIRKNNRNRTPAEIIRVLTVKMNKLSRDKIGNKHLKQNVVKFTKTLSEIASKQAQNSDKYNKKAMDIVAQ